MAMDLINYEQLILKVACLPQPVTRRQANEELGIGRGHWENCLRICRWMPWVSITVKDCPVRGGVSFFSEHRKRISGGVTGYIFTINQELRELCQRHRATFEAKLANEQALSPETCGEPRSPEGTGSGTGLAGSRKKPPIPSKPSRSNVRKRVVQECRRCLVLDEQLTELWRFIIQTRREQAKRREQTKWSVGYLQVAEANDLVDRVVKLLSEAIEKPKVPRNSSTNNNTLDPTAIDDRAELNSDTTKEPVQ